MNRLDRLRNLIDDRFGGKQSSFAHAINRSPAQVNQWLSGVRGLGDGACRVIETAMGLPMGWMDGLRQIPFTATALGVQYSMSPFETTHDSEYLSIRMVNITAGLGEGGCALEYIEDDYLATIIFKEKWFDAHGYKSNELLALKVTGQCMEPTLHTGDLVVIDTNQICPVDGLVFAALYEGVVSIKRLVRDAGAWWLESDNADKRKYPRKACTAETTKIVGRVVYKQSEQI